MHDLDITHIVVTLEMNEGHIPRSNQRPKLFVRCQTSPEPAGVLDWAEESVMGICSVTAF